MSFRFLLLMASALATVGCSQASTAQKGQEKSRPPASNAAVAQDAGARSAEHVEDQAAGQVAAASHTESVAANEAAEDAGDTDDSPHSGIERNKDAAPEEIVTAFLEATRRGDDRHASSLLSRKALEETQRIGLALKPPGTPSMQYMIERVEYPEGISDGAYVHSLWSERYGHGESPSRISWVLRRQEAGWRIVGMAAEMAENEPPYFLNFEQPEDLYRRIQEAEAPLAEAPQTDSAAPATQTAAEPTPLQR